MQLQLKNILLFLENEKGLDSKFSIEPKELKQLVKFTREAWSSLGKEGFSRSSNEIKNKEFRRSIYFVKDLKAGHIILRNDIKRIRPGKGLPPKYFEEIIGKKTRFDVERGDPVSWSNIK